MTKKSVTSKRQPGLRNEDFSSAPLRLSLFILYNNNLVSAVGHLKEKDEDSVATLVISLMLI